VGILELIWVFEKRINYLHHIQTKKRVKKVKDTLKIKKGGKKVKSRGLGCGGEM